MCIPIHNKMWLVIVSMAVVMSGCGGGDTNVAGGGGGVVGTGKQVVTGEVTGFGSIFVNGIEFSTGGAAITIDDTSAIESELKAGMIVKVSGTVDDLLNKGTAVKVEARDALEGRIDALDPINKTITVMGQTVQVEDNVTRLNDNDAIKLFSTAGFALNDLVEVNGYADQNGGLRATRVARKPIGEFEIKGFITGLNAASFGLALIPHGAPTLTVRFSAGQLPAGAVNGSKIQVISLAAPVTGEIVPRVIRLEDALGVVGEFVETEGFVTSGTLADFIVNGQRVVTDSSTQFEGGVKSDFFVGVKLEAEGSMNPSGVMVASKITYRSTIKIEADASNVVPGSSLSVIGKQVGINTFTKVDPGLSAGSHVEVRAVLDRTGSLLATRIVVLGASSKVILQGPLSASNAATGTLDILGINVVSNAETQWRSSSTTTDAAVSKAEFYSRLKPNSIVKVRWDTFTATTDFIKEAEIELGK